MAVGSTEVINESPQVGHERPQPYASHGDGIQNSSTNDPQMGINERNRQIGQLTPSYTQVYTHILSTLGESLGINGCAEADVTGGD